MLIFNIWLVFVISYIRCSKIIKSNIDNSTYEAFILPQGMHVLLVHNQKFSRTSFSVSVKVGNNDDPEDCLGLTHFLEHMLFMGSETYPGEDQFKNFVFGNHGQSNGITSDQRTTYYCDINSELADELAKRFSSLFICPEFPPNSAKRELEVIHSEYSNSLSNLIARTLYVLKSLMKEGVKEKRFGCGNKNTLKLENKIVEKVREFFNEKYSSDIMNLVICSDRSIEEMKKFVDYFSKIKNNNRNKNVTEEYICPNRCEIIPKSINPSISSENCSQI